jgi:mannose-6-phosphate isomerase-like protein (cupin superfamily)
MEAPGARTVFRILTPQTCGSLTPRMFAVNHAAGEALDPAVAGLLDPVDPASLHFWDLKREQSTELHFHEHDEHWLWCRGRTKLTIRLPDGRAVALEIGPGWIVYCLRGVEHGHQPLSDWGCFESTSILRPGARPGHMHRTL